MNADVRSEIERLGPWFHNLHLPDGTQTCPEHPFGDFPRFKWEAWRDHLPEDLSGWTALDIGCNAGFYSLQLAGRGARVTAVDVDPHYLAQARWAVDLFGLSDRITLRRQNVYELARQGGAYDLVLFQGVFYHLRYPLLALDGVARMVRRLMVFQAMTMPGDEVAEQEADIGIDERERLLAPGWPHMAFLEHRLQQDPTNWWAPNRACCLALLRSTGLRVLEEPVDETWLCEPDRDGPSSFWRWDAREFEAAAGIASGGE